jgi:pimeloyl-ACP methyl ester carboxylesterase
MIHGWSASGAINFDGFGWTDAFRNDYSVVLPDLRGHGSSAKPRSRQEYTFPKLACDVVAVMDEAEIERALVFGYSSGAQVAVQLLLDHPERIGAAALGGIGTRFQFGWGRRFAPEDGHPRRLIDWFPPRHFFDLARWLLSNPVALGACFLELYHGKEVVPVERLGDIHAPVLVVNGTRDGFTRSAAALVEAIPGARLELLSGRNHASALGDRRLKEIVRRFCEQHRQATAAGVLQDPGP